MKLNQIKSKSIGFTLIEILVYMALSSIVISVVIAFGMNIIGIRVKAQIEQEVNQALRLTAEKIDLEIRNASGINTVTATSISLSNTDAARNPTVIDLSGNQIRIGYGATGGCPALAPCSITDSNLVSNVTFVNLSSVDYKTKNISYRLTVTNSGSLQEYNYSKSYASSTEVRSN